MPLKGRIVVSEVYCKGCELCVADARSTSWPSTRNG